MNLEEMSHERQVGYLRSVLRSKKSTLTGFMALFALRHHAITKHNLEIELRPCLRWYLGQLAKEYIRRYYREAKDTLENFSTIGLLDSLGAPDGQKEFTLKEPLFPALREALEEAFGKEAVEETLERAKFYKAAGLGPVAGPEDASDANGKRRSKA